MRELHRISAFVRNELRAPLSLAPLILLSLLVVFGLTQGSVTLAYPSFQSPVDTPITEPPTPTTSAPPWDTAAPTSEVPAEPTQPPGDASPEPTTPGAPPMETPPVSPITPTITLEAEPPPVEPELTPTEGAPPPADEEEPSSPTTSRAASLIDTCVLGFSYVWLCLGGLVLVLFVLGVAFSFLLRRA